MNEFIELVRKMRDAQKNYFTAMRGSDIKSFWLRESKIYEAKVDACLLATDPNQGGLFNEA